MSTLEVPTPAHAAGRYVSRPAALRLEIDLPVRGLHQVDVPTRHGKEAGPRDQLRVNRVKWAVFISDVDGLPIWSVTLFGHRLDFWGEIGTTGNVTVRIPARLELPSSPAAHVPSEPMPSWVPVPAQWIDLARALVVGAGL